MRRPCFYYFVRYAKKMICWVQNFVAHHKGVEPLAFPLGGGRSIRLS